MTIPMWTWLRSDYGGEVHAFNPTAFDDQPYMESPCEHTAPKTRLHDHAPGDPFCVACLVAVGQQIPRGQEWRA